MFIVDGKLSGWINWKLYNRKNPESSALDVKKKDSFTRLTFKIDAVGEISSQRLGFQCHHTALCAPWCSSKPDPKQGYLLVQMRLWCT